MSLLLRRFFLDCFSSVFALRSKFGPAIPQKDLPKLAKEFDKRMFSIPEMGPYLVVGQYGAAGQSIAPRGDVVVEVCDSCRQSKGQLRKCSVCHSAQYCSVECQKADWKEHKLVCKRVTPTPSTTATSTSISNAAATEKLEGVD